MRRHWPFRASTPLRCICGRPARARRRGAVALLRCAFAASIVLAGSTPAHAEEPPAPTLEFRADSADLDPEATRLSLDGNVRLRCGRFRLRADHLAATTSDGRVDIEGPAEVTLCPCDDAPVSVAFDSATIDPPSDLVLRNPSARVGGTTILWLPALWLRAPDRPGLLPPRVAWRGRDGLLLGPGVHLPWTDRDGDPAVLRLYLSGYTSGGFEIEPVLLTSGSTTRARLDRAGSTLVAVDSHGSLGDERAAVLAWDADVSHGDRAVSGLIELERAARRYDDVHARVSARPGVSAVLATGVDAVGPRGPGASLAVGPVASLETGGAISSSAVWQLGAFARMLEQEGRVHEQLHADARVEGAGPLGPLRLGAVGSARAMLLVRPESAAADVASFASLRASLPLARRYAPPRPWLHVVEPFVSGTVLGARAGDDPMSRALRTPLLRSGSHWIGQGGLRNALGIAQDRGVALRFGAGAVGAFDTAAAPMPAAVSRFDLDLGPVAFASESAAVHDRGRFGIASMSWARAGRSEGSHLRGSLASQFEGDPVDARALTLEDGWAASPWLDRSGWSLSPGATLALGRGVRFFGDGWWELPHVTWLGAQGGAGYRHPCGCLGAAVHVAHRLGRAGTDAWLALDLAP